MTEEVISFDRTEKSFSIVERPEKYSELFRLTKGPIIAKGAGLSYGNAAAVQEGISVDMRYFNRIHSFDPGAGAHYCRSRHNDW
jgi:FAD/FMN-containing dehydrogenase